MKDLTIGEVVAATGLSHDTLRYYERIGLLPSAPRTTSGHRRYPAAALDQLAVVRALRDAGFGIAEIESVVAVKETAAGRAERISAMQDTLRSLLAVLDERRARIDTARSLVLQWQSDLAAADPDGPACDPPR